jgi:hypothetical protein
MRGGDRRAVQVLEKRVTWSHSANRFLKRVRQVY